MRTQKPTKAVGYAHVATESGQGAASHEQRHRDTLTTYCNKDGLFLTYTFVDIAGGRGPGLREGRSAALDLLCVGQASVLVVPSLAHLSRSTADVLGILGRYFAGEPVGALVSIGEGIDTRTPQGRMALDVLKCVAGFERTGRKVYHA